VTPQALEPAQLRVQCNPNDLDFETTAELDTLGQVVGQDRALDALYFGIDVRHEGYNLYVIGQAGVGKYSVVRKALQAQAVKQAIPPDWCYINNFNDPQKPLALKLPPGLGRVLKRDMDQLVQALRTAIPAAFESEVYRTRVSEIEEEFKQKQDDAFAEVQEEAEKENMAILHTPQGFGIAPTRDGEVIKPDDFRKLPEEDKRRIEATTNRLKGKLTKILLEAPIRQKERQNKAEQLNREIAMSAIKGPIEELRQKYADMPQVLDYLDNMQTDVLEHLPEFGDRAPPQANPLGLPVPPSQHFKRYQVNLMVDQSDAKGAPVVFADNPSYQNLIGRVEYSSQLGNLITDFTNIRPGALHRANSGYLILEIRKLLLEPYAWHALKRALNSQQITIESLGQLLGLVSTVSLEPQPIPLNVKMVLLGDHLLYYLLCQFDPEFKDLFKVAAEFESDMDRSHDNVNLYAQLIATLVQGQGLLPFDRRAVAQIIDHSARMAGDAEKLSMHMRRVVDLLVEASYWAGKSGKKVVEVQHVKKAVDKKIYRLDRVREKIYESIQRKTLLIDTVGQAVGQVNGLSVLQTGDFSFGQPSRITATARLGKGEVIDIQREIELGGAIHSKGVLIISAFLGARYARQVPLSLSASLVFEQTYGMVEGDSASVAELCALLSALSGTPIKQNFAVTGSVNQRGQVQAIGGVNEKIEAFFDICKARGLTENQGVLIPFANIKHLMLREDVVEAAAAGRFHVYPVDEIDQAIALLTGEPAGARDAEGNFPSDTVNGKVEAKLMELTQASKRFAASETKPKEDE
jgi:lon-related putative ATP-dependent protease